MRVLFILVISVVLLSGCASSKKTIKEGSKGGTQTLYDESFDPLSLNDDDIEIKKRDKARSDQSKGETQKSAEATTDAVLPVKEADGYRVQILATKSYEAATVAQQTAAEQFAPLHYKTYISFEAPQYKVRVGDALTRSEAEEIREAARDFGYKGAFIVRSKVQVSEGEE